LRGRKESVVRRMPEEGFSSSYYLSPFFLSFLLTASLPPFSQSSSSLLLPHSSPFTSSLSLSLLREAVRKRMERKGEKGSEEDDYFNKFPPTMPSVVLENRLIRMFKVSYRSAPKKQHLCFTGDNGFYADRKFKMVDSEGQNCFENL
jgi:hypothetical protein